MMGVLVFILFKCVRHVDIERIRSACGSVDPRLQTISLDPHTLTRHLQLGECFGIHNIALKSPQMLPGVRFALL